MMLTKPETRILPSPVEPDGPVGAFLTAPLACLGFFLTPPTGAVAAGAVRPPRLPLPLRLEARVEIISSRDLSSLAAILNVSAWSFGSKGEKLVANRIVRISSTAEERSRAQSIVIRHSMDGKAS
jgi:hypothetical protein